MIFWDTSAMVALLVDEQESCDRMAQLRADPQMAVWWATPVEIESAIQRRLRDGSLDAGAGRLARERLADLSVSWHEVHPLAGVRKLAVRLLRTHPLRAADSLQLAAALVILSGGAHGLRFACADIRLKNAADAEGLECL